MMIRYFFYFYFFSLNDLISDLLLVDEYLRGKIVNVTTSEDGDEATVANQTSSILRNATTRACSLVKQSEVEFLNVDIDTVSTKAFLWSRYNTQKRPLLQQSILYRIPIFEYCTLWKRL